MVNYDKLRLFLKQIHLINRITSWTNTKKFKLSLFLLLVLAALFCPSFAVAHFIWVSKSPSDGIVKIYFGEGPHPDQAQFPCGLKDMKVWSVDSKGKATEIKFAQKTEGSDGWFECESGKKLGQVDVRCEYGVFGRGDKAMFLDYSGLSCEFF